MKLIYSELAVKDLTRLRSFIAEYNPSSAARVTDNLIERIEKLTEFPRLGAPVKNAPDPETVRDLILDDYTVRYSHYSEMVVILRLWHHRENRISRTD